MAIVFYKKLTKASGTNLEYCENMKIKTDIYNFILLRSIQFVIGNNVLPLFENTKVNWQRCKYGIYSPLHEIIKFIRD